MKALTIIQPWATLLAAGKKRIETRSWKTNYRGEILIHAALKRADKCNRICAGRLHSDRDEETVSCKNTKRSEGAPLSVCERRKSRDADKACSGGFTKGGGSGICGRDLVIDERKVNRWERQARNETAG